MLPDDGLNFRDLIIRVAEEAGTARLPQVDDDPPRPIDVPEDLHELDRCKRAINDGISELVRAYPKWRCLRRLVSETFTAAGTSAQNVGGAAGRKRLSNQWQLIAQGEWSVRATGSGGRSPSRLRICSLAEVAALQATNPTVSAMPQLMGVGPVENVGDARSVRLGTEMRIWPVPSIDVVVEGLCRVRLAKLVEDQDLCPMGSQHDRAIVRFAMMILSRTNPDLALRKWHQEDAQQALLESMGLDNEEALPSLGRSYDGSEEGGEGGYQGEQVYVNGVRM